MERGVALIDTADNYGPDLAEELIADALRPYGEQLVVATKSGVVRIGPDQWHVAGRPEQLRAMSEASLRRLRVERIGLYQLHRFDPAVPMAEHLGALAQLRAEGKIRHIGLDTVTAGQLRAAGVAAAPFARAVPHSGYGFARTPGGEPGRGDDPAHRTGAGAAGRADDRPVIPGGARRRPRHRPVRTALEARAAYEDFMNGPTSNAI